MKRPKKRSKAVVAHSPVGAMIYATNCIPMKINIQFPPDFTPKDQARVWEAIRAVYDEITDRIDAQN